MSAQRSFKRSTARISTARLLSGLALSGVAIATTLSTLPIHPSLAQTNPGITLWGGVDSEYRLPYTLRNNRPRSTRAQYYLRVPGTRIDSAVSKLSITYPEAFTDRNGSFNTDEIRVRRGRGSGDREIPIDEVVWIPEASRLEIFLTEDIPADTSFVIDARVRNPDRFGMHRFNLQAESRGDVLPRYLGTWELLVAEDRGRR
ncbi:hypothetical protein S7335_2912 [Synechococcus sp. PCC 7335]|uniref:DUF2808 domain-containing protein n=1 Tax=Synechococcus sp. (strain ATCC 29403 / PCC 7335) TaxID=91464 RepID=UPI00017EDFE8|nr:DUF2808 domain-containing protein [Synechococcus sp. PCC 7335]EDX85213.1 hypothetical protein S7335_2912 [Synechococcus sp. PCC 7335]